MRDGGAGVAFEGRVARGRGGVFRLMGDGSARRREVRGQNGVGAEMQGAWRLGCEGSGKRELAVLWRNQGLGNVGGMLTGR